MSNKFDNFDIYELKKAKREVIDNIHNRNTNRIRVIQDAIEKWDKGLYAEETISKLRRGILEDLDCEILNQELWYDIRHKKDKFSPNETITIELRIGHIILNYIELTHMENLTASEEHEVMDTMNQCLDKVYLWLNDLGFTVDTNILNSCTNEYHDCIRNEQEFEKAISLVY